MCAEFKTKQFIRHLSQTSNIEWWSMMVSSMYSRNKKKQKSQPYLKAKELHILTDYYITSFNQFLLNWSLIHLFTHSTKQYQGIAAGRAEIPGSSNFLQLLLGDPQPLQCQLGDIIPPVNPGMALGPSSSWPCLVDLKREAPRGHPYQVPKPSLPII